MTDGARCATSRAGPSLSIRRELIGDLDRNYAIATSSQMVGAAPSPQAAHRSTVTARWLGPCAVAGNAPSMPDAAPGPPSSHEPLPVVLIRMLAPMVLLFGSIATAGWLFRRRCRDRNDRANVANIVTDAAGAATIPVLVTYSGVRGLPWWYAVAMNNAKPLLVVEPDGIRFRVVRTRHRRFADIACVDVRQGPGTVNLDLAFHGSVLTFAANVGTVALAAQVVASMPPGVPLSSRAQAVKATA